MEGLRRLWARLITERREKSRRSRYLIITATFKRLLLQTVILTRNCHGRDRHTSSLNIAMFGTPVALNGNYPYICFRRMKKALAILLITSYLLCACGISFAFHHCRGELKYVNVHSDKKKTCCKGKKMPKGCCKTVKITYKKTDDKIQSFVKFIPKVLEPLAALQHYPVLDLTENTSYSHSSSEYHLRPPPLRPAGLPLYIIHSVYRIWYEVELVRYCIGHLSLPPYTKG